MSVVTITGNNSFLIDQTVKEITDGGLKDNGPDSIERINAETMETDEVLSRLSAVSLFADKSLLLIRGMSENKELSEKFVELITRRQPDNDLVIVEPRLDKRSKLYAALRSNTQIKELIEPEGSQLPVWVVNWTKEQGGIISAADAAYLIDRVGKNQQLLTSEIEKLLIFNPNISKKTIDLLVEPNPQSTVFNLAYAALNRDYKRVVKLYREQQALKQGTQKIIGSLAWQLHIIALVKLAGDRSLNGVSAQSGVNPRQLNDARKLAANISFSDLVDAINRLLEIDVKSKSKAVDADSALLNFLLSF